MRTFGPVHSQNSCKRLYRCTIFVHPPHTLYDLASTVNVVYGMYGICSLKKVEVYK